MFGVWYRGEDFWKVVYEPFLADITREDLRADPSGARSLRGS
jgi:hypothetical protein